MFTKQKVFKSCSIQNLIRTVDYEKQTQPVNIQLVGQDRVLVFAKIVMRFGSKIDLKFSVIELVGIKFYVD